MQMQPTLISKICKCLEKSLYMQQTADMSKFVYYTRTHTGLGQKAWAVPDANLQVRQNHHCLHPLSFVGSLLG